MPDVIQIILIISTAALALLTASLRNLLQAALCFGGMCICIGAIYWSLFAPYVALFQMLIYGGAVVVLFVSVIMFTKGEENE